MKSTILKSIAVFLAIHVLMVAINPVELYAALTNGPTQPEVYAHQPVDATDNVSLLTGAFNYTIPITSIPEYPMAIGYSSGMGMDEEASSFGFGFSGFSGAIARNMVGLPDDIGNANRVFNASNQNRWSASGEVEVSAGLSVPGMPVGIGASASVMGGYDNYKGAFAAFGFGLGINAKIGKQIGIGGGVSLNSDSRYGASAGYSVGITGLNIAKSGDPVHALGFSVAGNFGSSKLYAQASAFDTPVLDNAGGGLYGSIAGSSMSMFAPTTSVLPYTNQLGVSVSVPIPVSPAVTLTITGTYNSTEAGNQLLNKNVYGYMHMNAYDRANKSHMADMTIGDENAYDDQKRANPSYMQKDYFSVNCQGLSGNMQLMQNEYTVVSRNYHRAQYRDVGLMGLSTKRYETYPWHDVRKAVVNKEADILKMIKNGKTDGENDFDNQVFTEETVVDMNDASRRYSTKPVLKFRGDLAGSFNYASNGYNDYEPMQHEMALADGGSDKTFFLGFESGMPMYEVKVRATNGGNFNPNANKTNHRRSAKIDYYTVADVAGAVNNYSSLSGMNKKKLEESFYNHFVSSKMDAFTLKAAADSLKEDVQNGVNYNISSFNIIDNLNSRRSNGNYYDNLIADIRVRKTDGMTYIFNLPAFAKTSKSMVLQGKGIVPPVSEGGDYRTFSGVDRGKVKVEDQFEYPYAWLLTAIVGADYIDFDDIPGPSDGDLGYWVKFKYVKAADNYRWRSPFNGLTHIPGALHVQDDDVYSVSHGTKEIYYLEKVESNNYVAAYTYHKRLDGYEAGGNDYFNGNANNILTTIPEALTANNLGNDALFAVTSINLYKKHTESQHSGRPRIIKSTKFRYDYSTSSDVPNNISKYDEGKSPFVPYRYSSSDVGTGKLTLRQVQQFAYDGVDDTKPVALPSYQMQYAWEDASIGNAANPKYNNKLEDTWSNYYKSSGSPGLAKTAITYYQNYTEISKVKADSNAKVFTLRKIMLPGGGSMKVDFEAGGYSYVQDKKAYVMRRVKSITDNGGGSVTLQIDITDLNEAGANLSSILATGNSLYGEIAFYRKPNSKDESKMFISSGDGTVTTLGTVSAQDNEGRVYQSITLSGSNGMSPFVKGCKIYMVAESDEGRAYKESGGCGNIDALTARYASLDKASPLDAVRTAVMNVKEMFKKMDEADLENCVGGLCNTIYPHLSFLRTPVFKEKYTGTRVKAVTFNDEFSYSSNTDAEDGKNKHVTRYYYDSNGDGTGESQGVATIEPGGGAAAVIDFNKIKAAGFFPSPAIMYDKTTMEAGYQVIASSSSKEKDVISRRKGKTEYHFYTPKDNGLSNLYDHKESQGNPYVTANGKFFMFGILSWLKIPFSVLGKKYTIKVPIPLPVTVKWQRNDSYNASSHSYVDYSDIYGKPQKEVDFGADGKVKATREFVYFDKTEAVPVVAEATGANDPYSSITSSRPGRIDQVWSESYYTKSGDINLVPWFLYLGANTNRDFNCVTVKHTYLPPVMKQVKTTTSEGLVTEMNFTAFDYMTGEPVEVQTKDSYKNTRISRMVPAYWKYQDMGPADLENVGYNNTPTKHNRLSDVTGNYMYLNTTNNSNLLSADIKEWSSGQFSFTDGLVVNNMFAIDPANSNNIIYKYSYDTLSGTDMETIYNANGKTRSGARAQVASKFNKTTFATVSYINGMQNTFKPIRAYVYEADKNPALGTFAIGTGFNYAPGATQDAAWKLMGTSTLFDIEGDVAESRSVLNKYASTLIGYNFSRGIAEVVNGCWKTSVYEGGENIYLIAGSTVQKLDAVNVSLRDAIVASSDNCSVNDNVTMNYQDFMKSPVDKGGAIALNLNVSNSYAIKANMTSIKAVLKNGTKQISRTLNFYLDESKNVHCITSRGEVFKGFFIHKLLADAGNTYKFQLLFDRNYVSFTAADIVDRTGVTSTFNAAFYPSSCSVTPTKTFSLPLSVCAEETHTGKNAFLLPAGGSGTVFNIIKSQVPVSEFNRKYTAMAWIHNSSPDQSFLQANFYTGSVLSYTRNSNSLSAPYVTAGNWRLVRLDLDIPAGSVDRIEILVKNNSQGGNVLYDDFRVAPFNASMTANVYDPRFDRLSSSLEENHLATWYKYDSFGRVVEVKKELDNVGAVTVKKYLYNFQKKN